MISSLLSILLSFQTCRLSRWNDDCPGRCVAESSFHQWAMIFCQRSRVVMVLEKEGKKNDSNELASRGGAGVTDER